MILELNPLKLLRRDSPAKGVSVVPVHVPAVMNGAVVVAPNEVIMSTAAVVPAAAGGVVQTAPTHNGFVRFIDRIGSVFKHVVPYVEQIAVDAEPFVLALSPFGPEYELVVNAIVGAQRNATASLAVGVGLTGEQKMELVLKAVAPALTSILGSKGITVGATDHVAKYAQIVYDLLTLPGVTQVTHADNSKLSSVQSSAFGAIPNP
ncbi:MAG: hypothetical protein M3O02_11210 [Acidobacteriota bacterium]|nr:hypothetical protein [Acidobacteriota bacterium]